MQADTILKPSPTLIRIIGFLLFMALGAGTEGFLFEYRQQKSAGLRMQTALFSENIRARLEGELNAVIFLSDSLAGFWAIRHDFASPGEIRGILADAFRRSRHVRGFAISEGYRITHVFPQDDEGQAIGIDYRNQAEQWPLIQRSVETHAPVLLGPAPPDRSIIYLSPAYVDGRFRGLLSTLIDDSTLFSAVGFAQANEACQYALRAKNESGANGVMLLGSAGLFDDPKAYLEDIAIPGGSWQLAVKSLPPAVQETWPVIFRCLGWLFAGLFAAQSTALLKLKRKLSDLALYDGLTGLPSRHLFIDRLKQMIRRTRRNRGMFSILFVSLNEFKALNYIHGEKVGDMMLAGIGKLLIGSIRHCDTVTRWGGDEFLILLDACPLDQATIIAENLRHKIELPVAYGEHSLRVGASFGLSTFPEDGHSLSALLKVADSRRLQDKIRRKNLKPPDSA